MHRRAWGEKKLLSYQKREASLVERDGDSVGRREPGLWLGCGNEDLDE